MTFCPFNRIAIADSICFDCPTCRWSKCWPKERAPETLTRACGIRTHAPADGPGTRLTSLLVELGIVQKSCDCAHHAATMNLWGASGCRENFETIIGWLRDEAHHRGLTFIESQARWLVRLAITLAEEDREPSKLERVRLRAMRVGNAVLNG